MAVRLYQLLLYLLPKSFRLEFGGEMAAIFSDRHADEHATRPRLWVESVLDVLATAGREHRRILRFDLRYAMRSLRRSPGYAALVITTIALGIGANTAIFTVVDHTLLRPLPFAAPDQLVKAWESAPMRGYGQVQPTPANFLDWKQQARSFEAMAAYTTSALNVTGLGRPQNVAATQTTADLFSLLGVPALHGRALLGADEAADAPAVVVISHAFWKAHFSDGLVPVGQVLDLDGVPHEIVGVMGSGFRFPNPQIQLWTPLKFTESDRIDRENHALDVLARLRADHTLDQARADLQVVAKQLETAYPDTNKGSSTMLIPLAEDLTGQASGALAMLFAAALGVLLIACANLANLLLARMTDREQELAVRTALGAGRERLVRQILTENLLLTMLGGSVGVALALASLPLVSHLVPAYLPISNSLEIDARILGSAATLCLVTALGFAVYPALKAARSPSLDAMRDGGRHGAGTTKAAVRRSLVVTEVALTMVLLTCAGLLIQALVRITQIDPGFETENVITMRTELPMPAYEAIPDREAYYQSVLKEVKRLPEVINAGFTGFLPFTMNGVIWPVGAVGDPSAHEPPVPSAVFRVVTQNYLETLAVNLRAGRFFNDFDTSRSAKVAVISESFAETLWPDEEPVGRQFNFLYPWLPGDWQVVGVVNDIRARRLEREPIPQVYVLHNQISEGLGFHAPRDLAVRMAGNPEAVVPLLREIIWQQDDSQSIADVRSLQALFDSQTQSRRNQLNLLLAFGLLAVIMASVGIYGLLSYLVSRQQQEMGVRMALGARPGDVLRLVIKRGLKLVGVGLVLGTAGSMLAGKLIEHLLFGVTAFDVTVLSLAALTCLASGFLACLIPAVRASRVEPLAAAQP